MTHDTDGCSAPSAGSIAALPASISGACFQPCDTGVDGWLVITATGWRTLHLRKYQAEWYIKGLKEPLLPAEMFPVFSASTAIDALARHTDEARLAVFERFCTHCGCVQPTTGRRCQCWNDE